MALTTTVLFDHPQKAIGGQILRSLRSATGVSIVTGFATPGGLEELGLTFKSNPAKLQNLIVGMATYRAFQVMDDLLAAGANADNLRVHLGHAQLRGDKNVAFTRYRPMLHSKIYYMEFSGDEACVFLGSNNMTAFALSGKNGEAAVLLSGDRSEPQFQAVRAHITEARRQAHVYSPFLREAFAWWTRDYLAGLQAEIELPQEDQGGRTIIIFASPDPAGLPKENDVIFFEIPEGIEQIRSLRTEVHVFIFSNLPSSPQEALDIKDTALAKYTCVVSGVDNSQGNRELRAEWFVDRPTSPQLKAVPSGLHRPLTQSGMQQVRARVKEDDIVELDYYFELDPKGWLPVLSSEQLEPSSELETEIAIMEDQGIKRSKSKKRSSEEFQQRWALVENLQPRSDRKAAKDRPALERASPRAGSFVLVAVGSRKRSLPEMLS